MNRLQKTFTSKKTSLITFIMGGDPDLETCWELLKELPHAGADIVELGMPFSDPTADGIAIQKAGQRALAAHTKLKDILKLAKRFRAEHPNTPLILMGYYNPILQYQPENFVRQAKEAGVDGVILVDLPPEEESEIAPLLREQDIAPVRLVAPTTPDERLPYLFEHADGFIYTIAIKGITGAASASAASLQQRVEHLRNFSKLPIAIGFGIRSAAQVRELKDIADGIVVGSALVEVLAQQGVQAALNLVTELAKAAHD